MSVQEYLAKMKNIQENLLEFLDSDTSIDKSFNKFMDFLKNQNIQEQYLIEFLHLLSNISINHCRKHNLILKIENILTFLKENIMQNLYSTRLFNIFKLSKRILLFLFEQQFITMNEAIYSELKTINNNYIQYFRPEIISYLTNKPKTIDPSFEENRQKGENENYICKLIQTDSVEEFITYVNKTNLSLSRTKIKRSIFETNNHYYYSPEYGISLIEYSAFYGSIQIFRYLLQNNVNIDENIWYYAVQSNNPELIHIIEEYNIKVDNYELYYNYSILCYHNEIAEYIRDNLMTEIKDDQIKLLEYRNYNFLPKDIIDKSLFFGFCKYDYLVIVGIMINDISANELNQILFNFF